jgi:hypothetical protein
LPQSPSLKRRKNKPINGADFLVQEKTLPGSDYKRHNNLGSDSRLELLRSSKIATSLNRKNSHDLSLIVQLPKREKR